MDPVFGEKIDAVRQAWEMLEMQYNAGPTSVLGDFCVRVFVPPFNNSYTVRLHLKVQRLRRNKSACRPAGGRVDQFLKGQQEEEKGKGHL